MRALKIAAFSVAGLLGLVVVLLLAVVIFVDPNDYRADIEQLVERQTGRALTLEGDLKLSIFPWLALQAGPAALGDAEGFGDEPFVAIREARVGVRLLPLLLRRELEVGQVHLAGARVNLITDETGRQNWSDFGAQDTEPDQPAAAEGGLEVPTIAGLQIEDAAVTIVNLRDKTRQVVRDFSLKTGRLASGKPFDLAAAFIFEQDRTLSAQVKFNAEVTVDLESNAHRLAAPRIDVTLLGEGYPADGVPVEVRADAIVADITRELYQLEDLQVNATWKGEGYPAAGVPIALRSPQLSADLAAQTLQLPELTLDVAGARLSGAIAGREILDAPVLNGSLQLAQISPRQWLPRLGIELPVTADPKVFETLAFSSKLAATSSSVELADIQLQFDDTTARGMFGVADLDAMALRFDLDVDRIDADRYLPPAEEGEQQAQDDTGPTPIPVEALRALNARGELRVEQAVFAGIQFNKLRLGVTARDGRMRLNPVQAGMYGGKYSGDIGVDATGQAARITLDETISGVDFAPLFKDFLETERVSGRGNATLKLNGSGRDTDELLSTLSGNVDFSVTDGALEGADVWYEIRRARALIKQQAVPERTGPARTPFTALQGTGVMKNGVLSNNDLSVATQYLRIGGRGTVDIPANQLDYNLVATVLKIPREGADTADAQDLVDAEIPIKITGALDDPKVRPDVEGYLKNQLRQRVDQEREKLEDKVREKLGDKLRNLLN